MNQASDLGTDRTTRDVTGAQAQTFEVFETSEVSPENPPRPGLAAYATV